jgi:hypothetical protein
MLEIDPNSDENEVSERFHSYTIFAPPCSTKAMNSHGWLFVVHILRMYREALDNTGDGDSISKVAMHFRTLNWQCHHDSLTHAPGRRPLSV